MSKKWYNYFVVTTPADVPSADTPAPAAERVSDLVAGTGEDTAFTEPVTTPADLAELYRSAQIPVPAHGYTVLKVAEMLHNEHIRALPADVKQKSIMVALDAAGVKVSDIVEDAVRRDRALDTYERVLQRNLEEVRAQKERDNQELEARIARNRAEVDKEQAALDAWRGRKREEEQRIAEAIGYFVSPNPITVAAVTEKDK